MNDQSELKTKPPLGIEPQYIWKQKRVFALVEAIARYSTAGMLVRNEWLTELGALLTELFPANVEEHTPPPLNSEDAGTEELHGGCCVSTCSLPLVLETVPPAGERKVLMPPEHWCICKAHESQGLVVSLFCRPNGDLLWDRIDERYLPENFVRIVGSEYQFVLGVQNKLVGEVVESAVGFEGVGLGASAADNTTSGRGPSPDGNTVWRPV